MLQSFHRRSRAVLPLSINYGRRLLEAMEPRRMLAADANLDLHAPWETPAAIVCAPTAGPEAAAVNAPAVRHVVIDNQNIAAGDLTLDQAEVIEFRGVIHVAGRIIARASQSIIIAAGAEIRIGTGGQVQLLAPRIEQEGGIYAAGGRVNLESTVQTRIGVAGLIDVTGGAGGDAGDIRLWSDRETRMDGVLKAGGGAAGGDGGLIEVSSLGNWSLRGRIDTDAPAGADGMLLIDPHNVTISGAGAGLETDADEFADTPAGNVAINVADLLTWGDVTIQANNDITIGAAISMGAGDSLTLRAGRSVIINDDITTQNEAVTITANDAAGVDGNHDGGAGGITMADGAVIAAGSGDVTLTIDAGDAGTPGDVTLEQIVTTGTVTITTVGGDIAALDAGAEANITAGTAALTISAEADPPVVAAAIGAVGTPLRTAVGVFNASTQNGGIYITETDGIVVESAVAREGGKTAYTRSGAVVLDSSGTTGTLDVAITAGGDIVFSNVIAPDAATIISTGGGIYDYDPEAMDATARTLTLQADGIIGQAGNVLDVTTNAINVSNTTGSVYLQESDGATVAATGIGDDLVITSPNGSLTINAVTATGDVTLSAPYGSILDGNAGVNNVTAASLTLTAYAAIGSAADAFESAVGSLAATTTDTSAPITIANTGALTSVAATTKDSNVSITFTGGTLTFVGGTDVLDGSGAGISFSNTGGGIKTGVIDAGVGDVTLTAIGTITDDANDAVADITGGTVTLTATGIGAAGNEIDTNAAAITASASSGGVYLREADAVTLAATAAGAGNDVDVSTAAGDMTLLKVTAADQVILAAGGSILDGNAAIANLVGATGTLTAGTAAGTAGNPLESNLATLNATTAGGGVFVGNNQALAIGTISATGGAVTISNTGNLTVGSVTAAGQTVTLTSSTAILDGNGAAVNVTADAAVLTGSLAGSSVDPLDTDIATLTAGTTAGGVFVLENDDLTVEAVTALGSGSDVGIEAGGDITLKAVAALGDDVTLTAGGAITDGNGAATNVSAASLSITAPGGVGSGGNNLELNVAQLDANGGGGGAAMVNEGPLALTEASLEGKGSAALSFEAERITLLDIADDEALIGVNGSVTLISRSGDIVFIDLDDEIRTQGTGTITVTAGTDPGSTAVAIVGNLTTAGGDIDVTAAGNVVIGLLDAGAGDVSVVSTSGVIVDGNGATVNIVAATANLTATAPLARTAQLTTTWAIANATATRAEAASKRTSSDSFASGAAVTAAAADAADAAENAAENNMDEKQDEKDDADDAVEPYADAVLGLTIASQALDVANTIAGTIAAVAQAVPFTGDGGSATAAFAIQVAKNAVDISLLVTSQILDAKEGDAAEAATELARAQAELYGAQQTLALADSTAKAFDEAYSIASAAATEAEIIRDASAVAATWAIAAEDQANGIGAQGSPLLVQADDVNALADDGSVYLSIVGDFNLESTTLSDPAGNLVVEATGDIIISGVVTVPGMVSLTAGNRILDGGGQILAESFAARAATYVGTSADRIEATVSSLAADGGAGGVFVNNVGAVAVASVDGQAGIDAGGDVILVSSGAIALEQDISAAGNDVTLTSTTGAISSTHTGTDVTAATLQAGAATGIALDTDVAGITAITSGAGNISFNEANAVTLTSVDAANGSVSVTAGGTITAASVRALTDHNANDIMLNATGGSLVLGTINAGSAAGDVALTAGALAGTITMSGGGLITGDALTATAPAGINIDTTVNAATLAVSGVGNLAMAETSGVTLTDVSTANGSITVSAGGSITATNVQSLIDADANDIALTATGGGSIAIATINAGTTLGDVTLSANTGAGAITTDEGGRVTADALSATAAGGIELVTTANQVDAVSSVSGDISVNELNAIQLGAVTATDGDVTLASGGAMTMAALGRVTGTDLAADAAGGMTLTTTVATADLEVTGTGGLTLDELNGLTLHQAVTADGNISITTGGSLAVGAVNAGAGTDDVTVTTTGAITESGADGAVDLTADDLTISATTGIGAALGVLEIQATTLTATGGSGGVYLHDLAGGLTVLGAAATGGDIDITASSPLTISGAVANSGGDVNLTAGGSAGDDDLTINADVSADGDMTLTGADDVLLDDEASLAAGGTLTILADQTADDAEEGSSVLLAGQATAGTVSITTGGEADIVTLAEVTAAAFTLTTGAGADAVTLATDCDFDAATVNLDAGSDTLTLSTPITHLNGGADDDTLTLKLGGALTGTFAGGAGYDAVMYDHDHVSGDDYVGAVSVNLQTGVATAIAGFTSLERFDSTHHASDHLTGANAAATWNITAVNAGNIGGAGVFDFTGFGNLTGGTANDVFTLAAATGITGNLQGGGGFNTLNYDLADFGAAITITLTASNAGAATAVNGTFADLDRVVGDADFAATNALIGNPDAGAWNSTGVNAGNIDELFYFENIGSTTGNADDEENYVIDDGAVPDGDIVGGAGHNVLDMSAWSYDIQWFITGPNAGRIETPAGNFNFTGMTRLIGSAGADTFVFNDESYLADGIDGMGGEDLLDFGQYTRENVWTGSLNAGTIATTDGPMTYANMEHIVDGLVSTLRFRTYDLAGSITRMTLPANIVRSAQGSIDLRLRNDGNTRISQHLNFNFYLSTDDQVDGGDVLVGAITGKYIDLRPNYTTTCGITARVPADAAPGTYNILAVLDSSDQLDESNELNNLIIHSGTVQIHAPVVDLSAVFTTMTLPASVLPGAAGNVTLRLTNNGNIPLNSPIGMDFFLSEDATLDEGDVLVRSLDNWRVNLAPGAAATCRTTITVPQGTTPALYQVLARVDADGQVGESNEANNIAIAGTTVNVVAPVVDLQVASARINFPDVVVPGDRGNFSITLENAGNITASGRIGIDVYASSDDTLNLVDDIQIATVNNRSIRLTPGGQTTVSLSATIPDTLLPDNYRWFAVIDSDAAITESDESNNTDLLNSTPTELVWKFGDFSNRNNVALQVRDSNGQMTRFYLSGNGYGSVIGGAAFDEIVIVGSDQTTKVDITSSAALIPCTDLTIRQPIYSLWAPKLQIAGQLTHDGNSRSITIKNPPILSVSSVLDATAGETADGEPLNTALFRISRNTTFCDLQARFYLSGSARLGRDYTLSVNGEALTTDSVFMPQGTDHVDILVTVLNDAIRDANEQVRLNLRSGLIYALDSVSANRSATATIADNDV